MSINNLGLLDREKAAFKDNANDGGVDKRVTDLDTQAKLDEVIVAIEAISTSGNIWIDGGSASSLYTIDQQLDGGSASTF